MSNRSHVYALIVVLLLGGMILAGCSGGDESNVFQNVSERVSWSSQGRIAFASFGGNGLLYVYSIDTDGHSLTLLTLSDDDDDLNDEGGRQPDFSPDGQQIVMSARRGQTPALYLMDAERGDRDAITQVTDDSGTGADMEPNFDPSNGDRIFYTSTRDDGNPDIMMVDVSGGLPATPEPIVATGADEHWAAVSPDGSTLAYQSDETGNTDIWTLDLTDPAATAQNLTAGTPFRDEAPAWSADGTRIAFHSNRNGDFDIFLMNADGSEQVPVTADARSDGYPVFNPDGDRLAITRDREVWTIPAQPWADWQDQIDELSDQLTRRF